MSACVIDAVTCDGCPPRDCDGHCDDLCRLLAKDLADPEFHEAWHRSQFCRSCGQPKDGPDGFRAVVKRCMYGMCRQYHCPDCDTEWYSDGPVGCRCNTSWSTRPLVRLMDATFTRLGRWLG